MVLYDSELKVMQVLWEKGSMTAGDLCRVLTERIGWNRNTTYTVVKKCIAKNYIARNEPRFLCVPLISKEEAQTKSVNELLSKLFNNSKLDFFHAFLKKDNLNVEEIKELQNIAKKLK